MRAFISFAILFLLFFSKKSYSQPPTIVWQKFFGGNNVESFGGVIQLSNGNFLVSGTAYSNNGDCSNRLTDKTSDAWLFELGRNGNIVKEKYPRIPTGTSVEYNFTGGGLCNLNSNGFLLQGYYSLFYPYLLRFDDDFNQIWNFGGLGFGEVVYYDNYIYNHTVKELPNKSRDLVLVKLDVEKNIVFERNYGGNLNEMVFGNKSLILNENSIKLIGSTESNNSGDVGANNARRYASDLWLVTTDLNGNLTNEKSFGVTGYGESPNGVLKLNDGSLLILSTRSDYEGFYINISKINSNNNIIWEKTYRKDSWTFGSDLIQDSDGGFLILGDFYLPSDVRSSWLIKIGENGDVIWEKEFGENGRNYLRKVIIDKNGDYYLFGMNSNPDFTHDGHHGPFNLASGEGDIWVLKLQKYPCINQPVFTISTNWTGFNIFKSIGHVKMNSSIPENSYGIISAKNSILMEPGFEINCNIYSSNFNILGCDN